MNTEITDKRNVRGWILFDAHCRLCTSLARRCERLLGRHQFVLVPLQTPWVRERLTKSGHELLLEMRLLTSEGALYGGADALLALARQVWWAWPLYWLSHVPGVRPALRKAYRWLARHRTCLGGGCPIELGSGRFGVSLLRWVPAVALPILAAGLGAPASPPACFCNLRLAGGDAGAPATLGRNLPGWVWMWVLVLALFLVAKWITISRFLRSRRKLNRFRLLAYALFWPGMDAPTFCTKTPVPTPPIREWALAGAKTLFGAALLWVGVPLIGARHSLLAGWTGMIGLGFLLHFGLFHLLSLLWRALGINARPIMRSPGTATSLSKFWGTSWNAAFSDLIHQHFFKGLAKGLGARRAMLTIFLISGVLHDLVISVPAHGGYGLPTLYFLIQGSGLLFERSKLGRRFGLGSGWKGWCFVALMAGAPAFWLFHPTFVHNVILPMLHAIGAT